MSSRSVGLVVAASACGGPVRSVGGQSVGDRSPAIEETPETCDGAIGATCNGDNLICDLQNLCVSPSYTVNSNGTVTDNNTGLIWEQKIAKDACPRSSTAGQCSWDEAKAYCKNLKLGGSSAWRMPTLPEMLSLVDVTGTKPTIDRTAFPHTPYETTIYWTTDCHESDAGVCDDTIEVSFYDGLTGGTQPDAITGYVRCVR